MVSPDDIGEVGKSAGSEKPWWDGPPRPPSPSVIQRDSSCLGILGVTLRQALVNVQAQSEIDSSVIIKTGGLVVGGAETVNDAEETTHKNNQDQDPKNTQPPFSPLQQLQKHQPRKKVPIQDEFISSVMNCFAQAVAKSQQEQYEQQACVGDPTKPNKTLLHMPSVLLRGRVDSYNRHSGKWRIAINDAKFRIRKPLPGNRPKRGGHVKKMTLWEHAAAADNAGNDPNYHSNEEGEQEVTCQNLELLLYNDNGKSASMR